MAGISSPVNGVDVGMFAHRDHIEALTQPRSLQPGSSPVLCSVMITTDASTHGWGVVCEGMPASGL